MKRTQLLSYLLAGAFLAHGIPAQSMDLTSLLPLTAGGVGSALLYTKTLATAYQKSAKFTHDKTSGNKLHRVGLPEILANSENDIQTIIQRKADSDHGIKDVTFLPYSNKEIEKYTTLWPHNIIYMPQSAYEMLLYAHHPQCNKKIAICNEDGTSTSYTQLHITGTPTNVAPVLETRMLNHVIASKEHELGHVKNESGIKKIRVSCMWPLIWGLSATLSHSALKDSPLVIQGAAHAGYAGFAYAINHMLNIAYGKYDETCADDAVPNDPTLLSAEAEFYQDMHETERNAAMQTPHTLPTLFTRIIASIIPTNLWNQYPLIAAELLHLDDEHPSPYFRAERFKKRLAMLNHNQSQDPQNK